jgi:hypothetical protein
MDKNVIGWLCIAILDLGVVALLRIALHGIDVRSVLREKDVQSQPPGTQAVPSAAVPSATGTALAAASNDPALDNTSYSRLSGFIGSVVMACFLWAIGNIVIYQAFNESDKISSFMSSISTYFLTGASLFAPYAFNQLSKVFKPG